MVKGQTFAVIFVDITSDLSSVSKTGVSKVSFRIKFKVNNGAGLQEAGLATLIEIIFMGYCVTLESYHLFLTPGDDPTRWLQNTFLTRISCPSVNYTGQHYFGKTPPAVSTAGEGVGEDPRAQRRLTPSPQLGSD